MTDHVLRISQLRIIKLSADLEVQLSDKTGGAVAIEILRRLRDRAAESLAALAFVDLINEKDKALVLQNEVKRYDEWVEWLREIINEGVAYDQQISDQEREEMLDVLTATPEGQRQAVELGLVNLDQQD
jgi:hypothetical protein